MKIFNKTHWVRVYENNETGKIYRTLGPFTKIDAEMMAESYLCKGVCAWIEEVKR